MGPVLELIQSSIHIGSTECKIFFFFFFLGADVPRLQTEGALWQWWLAKELRGKQVFLLTHQRTKTREEEEERQPLGSAPPHNVLRESRFGAPPSLYGGEQ